MIIALLRHKETGLYHPILFYAAPKPSEYDDRVMRHHSLGHVDDGYASPALAKAALEADILRESWAWRDDVFEWNGKTFGSLSHYFEAAPKDRESAGRKIFA